MRTIRVACLLFPQTEEAGRKITKIAEVCLRWTPQIAVTGEAIFLEIGRCSGLYREETLDLRLKALSRKFQCPFRVAYAGDAPTALACAKWGSSERVPIEALCEYADPFGTRSDQTKLVQKMVITLRKLGVTTVGAFLALPARTLPSHFGKLGILVHQQIREAAGIPWPRFVPEEKVSERSFYDSLQIFEDLEPLLFSLKPLMDRAMARLHGRGGRASKVRVLLGLEGHSRLTKRDREWIFDLALPQGSSLSLMPVLRERMSFDLAKNPLAAPVIDLLFEVLETAPGRSAQRDLFNAKEEEIEAWNSLIARVSEKLGQGKVFLAEPIERHLPEKAWIKKVESFSDEKKEEPEFPERPLRLLRTPLPLRKSGGSLLSAEKNWEVLKMEGPEILSGEWWFQQFKRNYFKVATQTGEVLWVFQTPGSEHFFLHGYFD